jgi:hypothetical protein
MRFCPASCYLLTVAYLQRRKYTLQLWPITGKSLLLQADIARVCMRNNVRLRNNLQLILLFLL